MMIIRIAVGQLGRLLKMKGTLGIAAVLAVAITYAVGHKCYVGTGRDKTEQDCSGSCSTMTSAIHDVTDSVVNTFVVCDVFGSTLLGTITPPHREGSSDVGLDCSPLHMEPNCTTNDGYKTCFCNTELCNTDAASGLRPLNIMWLLAVSALIAKLFLF